MLELKLDCVSDEILTGRSRFVAQLNHPAPSGPRKTIVSEVFEDFDEPGRIAAYNKTIRAISEAWEPLILGHSRKWILSHPEAMAPVH